MTNQYEALPLAALREAAKIKGLKGITALRKQELIDLLLQSDREAESAEITSEQPATVVVKNTGNQETSEDKQISTKRQSLKAEESLTDRKDKTFEKTNYNIKAKENGHDLKFGMNKDASSSEKKEEKTDEKTDVFARADNKPVNRLVEDRTEVRTNTRGDSKVDAKAESRTEGGAELKPGGRTELRPDGRTEIRPDGRAEFKSEVKTESKTDAAGTTHRKPNYIPTDMDQLDSGETKEGILEVMPDGYGFIRCDNFLPGENDVYVSPAQIRRFNLKTGDVVAGNTRIRSQNEKFSALLYVKSVNRLSPVEAQKRKRFEDLTPVFPDERIHLETPRASLAMRMVDLISPIGKGQRGMIVSQPKTGKTTLLKQIAKAITTNYPAMHLIILLIDERPEEVTDIKESIQGSNVEVIYSTFDELPENHKRVSEMVIERAKRLVEHKKDVVILLDSITRLARAYNLTVQASGRTLSGGLDPAALHMPKKFFGAARNMREGGSLTILATALVDTGSRMDDVVFEEFKGTGNMELVLDRSLSEKRIFPAIDLPKSSTRREDLLLSAAEQEAVLNIRKALNSVRSDEALERIIDMFVKTKSNQELVDLIRRTKIIL